MLSHKTATVSICNLVTKRRMISSVKEPPREIPLWSKSGINPSRRLTENVRKVPMFDPSNPEMKKLYSELAVARNLITKFNALAVNDFRGKQQILRELLNPACRDRQRLPLIESPFLLQYGHNVTVGHNFYANFDCVFLDGSPITIGDNCLLGPSVHIYTGTHPLDPKERQEYSLSYPVKIGNQVWIGGKSVVCPGVTIGDNVVVAAGSTVIKDIPSNVLIGGNPAKVIRRLDPK